MDADRLPMPQWIASHLRAYGQHSVDSKSVTNNNENGRHEIVRELYCEGLESWSRGRNGSVIFVYVCYLQRINKNIIKTKAYVTEWLATVKKN